MRALIMAGGAGSRLARGEKPLIPVCDRPMISYITDAFRSAGCEPIVVVSPKTPMTANWCRAQGIVIIRTGGNGYVDDMVQAVQDLDENKPLVISVSDIPCIIPGIITTIIRSYTDCGRDALSTWVPAQNVLSCRGGMPYREQIGGSDAFPAGVNILRGDRIAETQDEYTLLLDEPRLALNVNTREDLARTEAFLLAAATR
ncbi:MAG: 5-deoxyadenosylcobinamide phosphate nucleotidyltransferase [Methanoregulaceae archaeon]|nr:MAG: 5-deoxyadenosylcobinamide phosphate nucleotidyltransferase [Methanoregulaceae archaeon]